MSETPKEMVQEFPAKTPSFQESPLYHRLELAATLAIIVVAILLAVVLVKKFILPGDSAKLVAGSDIKIGTQLTIPGIDWAKNSKTALIFLSPRCGACTDSAPFYRDIATRSIEAGTPRIIAVIAGDPDAGRQYLDDLEVPVESVIRSNPQVTGVTSLPTILVADSQGRVVGSWRGKLPEEKQVEVMQHFRSD